MRTLGEIWNYSCLLSLRSLDDVWFLLSPTCMPSLLRSLNTLSSQIKASLRTLIQCRQRHERKPVKLLCLLSLLLFNLRQIFPKDLSKFLHLQKSMIHKQSSIPWLLKFLGLSWEVEEGHSKCPLHSQFVESCLGLGSSLLPWFLRESHVLVSLCLFIALYSLEHSLMHFCSHWSWRAYDWRIASDLCLSLFHRYHCSIETLLQVLCQSLQLISHHYQWPHYLWETLAFESHLHLLTLSESFIWTWRN